MGCGGPSLLGGRSCRVPLTVSSRRASRVFSNHPPLRTQQWPRNPHFLKNLTLPVSPRQTLPVFSHGSPHFAVRTQTSTHGRVLPAASKRLQTGWARPFDAGPWPGNGLALGAGRRTAGDSAGTLLSIRDSADSRCKGGEGPGIRILETERIG